MIWQKTKTNKKVGVRVAKEEEQNNFCFCCFWKKKKKRFFVLDVAHTDPLFAKVHPNIAILVYRLQLKLLIFIESHNNIYGASSPLNKGGI